MRLPVVDPATGIRVSRSGRWRAVSLVTIHALIVGHVLHWLWAGQTISPVEPSEAMETIRDGKINAGFIFFSLAILATLVLGRWVCGWGCHLVAYQDLTLWFLKKFKARPKAFRSRLLVFVPLLAAFYMFAWPAVARWWYGARPPELTLHATTSGFWDTFPGLGVAVLTVLVCGMAIIHFLGPKGFCTYACPYGAIFGAVDKLALGRIRVTDACHQCGHCTATCTSNVDVAREVNTYGMVVDPGCMKTLDCVSVCPNDALYFGFGAPAIVSSFKSSKPRRRFDLTWPGEFAAAIVFCCAFLAYRGLYGLIPFLLSLGIAGVVTFMMVKLAEVIVSADVSLQKLRLKLDGRVRPAGWGFVMLGLLVLALTAHSGWWRYHLARAERLSDELPVEYLGWQYDPAFPGALTADQKRRLHESLAHYAACNRIGLIAAPQLDAQRAWLLAVGGQLPEAVALTQASIDRDPDDIGAWLRKASFEFRRNLHGDATKSIEQAIALEEPRRLELRSKVENAPLPLSAMTWMEWGMFLAYQGRQAESIAALESAIEFDPTSSLGWMILGATQKQLGRIDEARASLIRSVELAPYNGRAVAELESLASQAQNFAGALAEYDAAIASHGDVIVFHHNRGCALAELGRFVESVAAFRAALAAHPNSPKLRAKVGAMLLSSGDLKGAIAEYETVVQSLGSDAEALLKLAFLYEQAGRFIDALNTYRRAERHGSAEQQQLAGAAIARLGRP